MGCPESLEFYRKYNHSITRPPKYQILVEFTKDYLNFIISGRILPKITEDAKYIAFNDPGWF